MASERRPPDGHGLEHAREITPAVRPSNDDSGREAEHSTGSPARRWKRLRVLLRVKRRVSRDNISIVAAGVAFYAFLAIPSALSALVALYGLAFNPADVKRQLAVLYGVMPADSVDVVTQQLQAVTSQPPAALDIGFVVALLVAIWGARKAMSVFIKSLNIAFGEEEKRGFFRFRAVAFGLTVIAVVFAALSIALIAILPAAIDLLPFGSFGKTIASVVRWPLLLALVTIGLAAIYRYAPSREGAKWRWTSWGATVATLLWIAGSALFSVYVGNLASYDKTYGSLGAVVVLMMWLYVSAFAVLLGAELNSEMEQGTARDTGRGR